MGPWGMCGWGKDGKCPPWMMTKGKDDKAEKECKDKEEEGKADIKTPEKEPLISNMEMDETKSAEKPPPSPMSVVGLLRFLNIKGAKIRNQNNQVPHLTQDTKGKVTNSQLDATNVGQEVSRFQAGDHMAQINRRAQRHSKHKTEKTHKISTKEVQPWNG